MHNDRCFVPHVAMDAFDLIRHGFQCSHDDCIGVVGRRSTHVTLQEEFVLRVGNEIGDLNERGQRPSWFCAIFRSAYSKCETVLRRTWIDQNLFVIIDVYSLVR